MYLQRRDFKQNTLKKDKGLQGRLASYESPQWSNRREKELTADLLFCVVNQRQAMKLILKKSYQISFHLILWSQSLKKSALSSFLKYWLLKFFCLITHDSFIHYNSRNTARLPCQYQVVCIFNKSFSNLYSAFHIHSIANTWSKSTIEATELLYRIRPTISIADVEQVLVRRVISIFNPVDKTLFNVTTRKIAQYRCLFKVINKDASTNVSLMLTLNKFHTIV